MWASLSPLLRFRSISSLISNRKWAASIIIISINFTCNKEAFLSARRLLCRAQRKRVKLSATFTSALDARPLVALHSLKLFWKTVENDIFLARRKKPSRRGENLKSGGECRKDEAIKCGFYVLHSVIGYERVTNCKQCFRCLMPAASPSLSTMWQLHPRASRWNHFTDIFLSIAKVVTNVIKVWDEFEWRERERARTEDWRQNFRSISETPSEGTTIPEPLSVFFFWGFFMMMTVVTHCTQHFSLVRKLILTS